MPPFCATAPTALILMYVKLKRWQTCNENTSKGWFFFLFFLFFSGGARWWPWHHSELVIYWSEDHYAGLRGGKVYGAVQTEWQCVEGWDLSVSLSGILTALALVCTQTSYMHVSLFTAPPPPHAPPSPHIYHFRQGPHAHTCHTQIQTHVCTHKSRG